MKKLSRSIMLFILAGLILVACRPAVPPSPPIEVKTPAVTVATPATRATWEGKWNTVLMEAKKEGSVAVYTIWRPETRIAITQVFREKYGIDLEISPFSRGAELLAKAQTEKRAGLNIVDVFGAGGPTLIATIKPEGLLGSMEPFLVLPEVTDPKFWSGGKFPFLDKDKMAIGMIASLQPYILYNTNLIKEGEITNYKDVLKPQYKGKITLNDPTVTGTGNAFLSHLAHDIWNLEEASEFLKQLIKQQQVVIQRDNRLHVESVARGKFAIGLAPNPDNTPYFLELGAPISLVINREGAFVTPAAGAVAISTKPAHPNATTVFVNWLLSKEGQTVFSGGFGNPSIRADVSTEGFHPLYLPQPGQKLFLDSEELILFRGRMLEIAKKIIAEAEK